MVLIKSGMEVIQLTVNYISIVTVRNSSCGKVMFSQVSVCPQGEVCTPWADTPWQTHPSWVDTPPPPRQTPPRQTPPRQTPPKQTPLDKHPHPWADTPADGYCSGRYASYWNAFLLTIFSVIILFICFVLF